MLIFEYFWIYIFIICEHLLDNLSSLVFRNNFVYQYDLRKIWVFLNIPNLDSFFTKIFMYYIIYNWLEYIKNNILSDKYIYILYKYTYIYKYFIHKSNISDCLNMYQHIFLIFILLLMSFLIHRLLMSIAYLWTRCLQFYQFCITFTTL